MPKIAFEINAVFTKEKLGYTGNPAACIFLDRVLESESMQAIAKKLEQPATTFIWEEGGRYKVRWFAPDAEIGLCGHGSAAAAVFMGKRLDSHKPVALHYAAGVIQVCRNPDHTVQIVLDGIAIQEETEIPAAIKEGLGIPVLAMYRTSDKHLIITDSESSLRQMRPDFEKLRQSDIFGYAVTAPGGQVDFVSRTLIPHAEKREDHATGSSHAILVPYWAEKFKKDKMQSLQLSPRGGAFDTEWKEGRVHLTGEYKFLEKGEVNYR